MKLSPEQFDAWIAALESGNWSQATGRLRRDDESGFGYCCLGVLCALQDPLGFNSYGNAHPFADAAEGDYMNLYSLIGQHRVNALIEMNDEQKAGFPSIAAYLRHERKAILYG